jgi:dsDNA-binding SOS-regulon protein
MDRVTQMLGPIAVVENPPRMEGRFLSMILVPNREVVAEALRAEKKAQQEEKKAQQEEQAAARAEAQPEQKDGGP